MCCFCSSGHGLLSGGASAVGDPRPAASLLPHSGRPGPPCPPQLRPQKGRPGQVKNSNTKEHKH